MHNYDIFEDPYETTCNTVIDRENEQLVLVGIEEMLDDTEERIEDITKEVEGLGRQLAMLRDRFDEISAKMN